MSSSDSEIDININENGNILGYQWEPEYSETELLEISRQENLRKETENNEAELNLNFCKCQNCEVLSSEEQCKCCRDFEHFEGQYIGEETTCITLHEHFDMICLNSTVLETAYVCFLRYKRYKGRAPEILNPRQSRLMAYRQFLCWVRRGQPLGKKKRVVLPSCVVVKIRKTFPAPDGVYEGFHDADNDSSSASDSD